MQFAEVNLNQEMLPVFLALMAAAAIAWFFLSNRLYTELRLNYPRLYKTLGSPKLFMKKSLATNVKVIRFILKDADVTMVEPEVRRLCQGLRSLFYIYMICLAGSLLLLLEKMD
jgi:hypothetical protein